MSILSFNNFILGRGDSVLNYDGTPGPSLPPYTIRLKFNQGTTPTFEKGTGVLVDAENNVWDLTYENDNWEWLLQNQPDLLEVLGGNTTGITSTYGMFWKCYSLTFVSLFDTSSVTETAGMFSNCESLTSVPLFDTSSVTNMSSMFYGCTSLITAPLFDTSNAIYMGHMFYGCTSLTTCPLFNTSNVQSMYNMFNSCTSLTTVQLFNTSKVTDIHSMFANCYNVQTGALALYQQVSTQTNPPIDYYGTFSNCGSNTPTGYAELEQIPSSWGGLG